MAGVERPNIFLLSLAMQTFLNEYYAFLFDSLSKSVELKRAKSVTGAIRYLETNNPKAILVTDEGLTKKKNKPVLPKLVSYLQNGGLVIVALHFPSFTNMDRFDNFFEFFQLPWKHGDYHRTDFQFNPSCVLPCTVAKDSFPPPFSMKVLHVKNAREGEKIFIPVPEATTQSHVFPPTHVDQAQAAVVGAKVGDGFLIYAGDVNGEIGSTKIILTMCGLWSHVFYGMSNISEAIGQ